MGRIILLGIVQGVTEFLPVSSSGHLVLLQRLFGIDMPGVALEVALHIGTLLAVLAVYTPDLVKVIAAVLRRSASLVSRRLTWSQALEDSKFSLGIAVLAGTALTGVVALVLRETIVPLYESVLSLAFAWTLTGLLLWFARPAGPVERERPAGLLAGLSVGLAQALATVPGISRSGATISCGLLVGLSRRDAARLSFLLSVPAIVGAAILSSADLELALNSGALHGAGAALLVGAASAAVTGFFALRFLLNQLRGGRLHVFAYYCWSLAGLSLLLSWWGV